MVCQHLSYDMVSSLHDMHLTIQALHGRQFLHFFTNFAGKGAVCFQWLGLELLSDEVDNSELC